MVTKIPTRSPAVSINSKTTTETANRLNIDDDFFEEWNDAYEPEKTNKCFEKFYGIYDSVYILG